jgi:hypothetical protein
MDVYLSAEEAAAILDISKPTLYAYVSRGLIRSLPGKDSRSRLYNRLDIDQLKARKRIRSRPQSEVQSTLHWGAPILDSVLTLIANENLQRCKRPRPRSYALFLGGSVLVLDRQLEFLLCRFQPCSTLVQKRIRPFPDPPILAQRPFVHGSRGISPPISRTRFNRSCYRAAVPGDFDEEAKSRAPPGGRRASGMLVQESPWRATNSERRSNFGAGSRTECFFIYGARGNFRWLEYLRDRQRCDVRLFRFPSWTSFNQG